MEISGKNNYLSAQWNMAVTAPIFTKFVLTQQLFLNNSSTEFHKDPTNTSVDDTTSQTEGHGLYLKRPFFHFVKNT